MTESIEIKSDAGEATIELRFDRQDDRWVHRWFVNSGSSNCTLMTSLEGTPDQVWPDSPPLQDVSRHSLEHGDAILCVGMAGRSHWSASYSVEPDSGLGALKADLACLTKQSEPQGILGSTYLLDSHLLVQSSTPQQIQFATQDQSSYLIDALVGEGFATLFELSDRELRIKPSLPANQPAAATRWGFLLTRRAADSAGG